MPPEPRPSAELVVAQAVHDLRQPLQALLGHLDLLAKAKPLPAEARERLADARAAAGRLREGMEHLREYLRSGRLVDVGEVDLGAVVERIRAEMAPGLGGGRIEGAGLPTVRGDPVLVARLLSNLVGNAVRYRRAEPPVVQVGATRAVGGWVVHVRDNGTGMDQAQLALAGTPFHRFHPQLAEGTGLGLASCHRIAQAHGWRLWAESRPGVGSTFHLEIPDGHPPPR